MSITVAQIVNRAYYRMSQGKPEAETHMYRFALEATIPDALNSLAQMASERPDYPLQNKEFPVTITSGVGALATNCAVHTIPMIGRVKDASGANTYSLQFVPSLQDLDFPRNDEFVYYTINGGAAVGGSIFIKAGTRAPATPTSLTVTAGVFPTLVKPYTAATAITDLAVQHEDDLINILVQLVTEKMPNATVDQGSAAA